MWAREWRVWPFKTLVSSVLSRQLRALPSEDPQQPDMCAPHLEGAKDSTDPSLAGSDYVLQASGNTSCLLDYMPQPPGTDSPLQDPCPGPILVLPANSTTNEGQLPTHSPSSVILQDRYSG